jgi:undecaprenyl-diphosphatase
VNDYALSLVLGIVEGVTEFLPVSSTAHLRIAEALLGLDLGNGYWKMFSIVIQLGAVACLPFYFRARIAALLRDFRTRPGLRHPLVLVLVAFLCTAVPSFLFVKVIGKHLESLLVMAVALLAGGVVMWLVDALYARERLRTRTPSMDRASLPQAVWIGLCQTLSAVFPGTSRSMATIAAGQLAGMTREAALEFSFFLSMPTMAAATLYDLLKAVRHPEESLGAAPLTGHGWGVLALGFVVSFVVAWAVVAWFMGWVRRRGFVPFAVYRIIAGALVLTWVLHHA